MQALLPVLHAAGRLEMSKESTGEARMGKELSTGGCPSLVARAGASAQDLAWDIALPCWHHSPGQRAAGHTWGPSLLQRGGDCPRGMYPAALGSYKSHVGSPCCRGSQTPPARLISTGKQHRASAGGFGMAGGCQPPNPSPELGVVDQGAEGSGEGGRFALQQPRGAGSGHGLPWGGGRRKGGGRKAGGRREAGRPGEPAGRRQLYDMAHC